MNDILSPVTTLVFIALLVESIVHIVQNVKEKETSWKYWAALAISIILSVVVTINWDIDLFVMVGLSRGNWNWVGPVLTGLILSRGSNVVSDLIGLINNHKKTNIDLQ